MGVATEAAVTAGLAMEAEVKMTVARAVGARAVGARGAVMEVAVRAEGARAVVAMEVAARVAARGEAATAAVRMVAAAREAVERVEARAAEARVKGATVVVGRHMICVWLARTHRRPGRGQGVASDVVWLVLTLPRKHGGHCVQHALWLARAGAKAFAHRAPTFSA